MAKGSNNTNTTIEGGMLSYIERRSIIENI